MNSREESHSVSINHNTKKRKECRPIISFLAGERLDIFNQYGSVTKPRNRFMAYLKLCRCDDQNGTIKRVSDCNIACTEKQKNTDYRAANCASLKISISNIESQERPQ